IDVNDPPGKSLGHGCDDYIKDVTYREAPEASGRPLIPERFRQFTEKGPIYAAVDSVRADGLVTLKFAQPERCFTGLLLTSDGMEVKVVSTANRKILGKPYYYWNSEGAIYAGRSLGTGERFDRPRGTGFKRYDHPLTKAERSAEER